MKLPRPKPKIGPYLERIAQIIDEDKYYPKKQRHTAKRIFERITEMGYAGGYTLRLPKLVDTSKSESYKYYQEVCLCQERMI